MLNSTNGKTNGTVCNAQLICPSLHGTVQLDNFYHKQIALCMKLKSVSKSRASFKKISIKQSRAHIGNISKTERLN